MISYCQKHGYQSTTRSHVDFPQPARRAKQGSRTNLYNRGNRICQTGGNSFYWNGQLGSGWTSNRRVHPSGVRSVTS